MVVHEDETTQAFRNVIQTVVNRSLSGAILPPSTALLSAATQQLLARIPLTLENLKAAFRCLTLLYDLDSQRGTQVFSSFIKCYASSPPLERAIIVEGIRTSSLPLYLIYLWLSIAEKESLNLGTPSPPRSLIMAILYGALTPIILGMGKNTHYNLGIASTGEVTKPRLVPVAAEIIKASLSTSHSLLLTSDGRVYAMGRCEGYRTGLPRNDVAASPQLVPLPKGTVVVDVAAGEGYSLFLTRKSLYGCGLNVAARLGLGKDAGPFQLQKIPLPQLRELILDEVVTTEKFTLITTSSVSDFLLAGTSFEKRNVTKTFEFHKDYDPEWDDIFVPCSTQLEVSARISSKPHCGIVTGQDVNLKQANESYTVRFVLFNNALRYRFAHSNFIGEVIYAIDGILFGFDVAEFSVDSKGGVYLRAALDTGITRRVYSVYRGRVAIWPKEDSTFETARSNRKKEINMSGLAIVFLLQPIANTSYATSLSVSPDGENAIFVIGEKEEQNEGKLRNWAGQRLIAEPIKEVPFDAKICLGGRSWPVMSSVLAHRVPESYRFLKGKVMHMEEAFHGIPNSAKREDWRLEVSQMVASYVKEGVAIWNAEVWEPESPALDFVKKALAVLGLKAVGPRPSQGKTMRALVPIVKGSAQSTAQSNCVLQCVDEDGRAVIETNRQLLELHSYYFVLAGKHEGRDSFVVRESQGIVEKILEAMASPDSLVQCTRDELCRMLIFCDAYAMDSLIDDIIRAFFINATASCLLDLSGLYSWSYYAQNFIIRELIARPDLLFLYTKSEEIHQEMAKRACEAIEAGTCRRSGVTTENALMIGQAIWHSYAHIYSDRTQVDEERLLFTALSFAAIQPYFTKQAVFGYSHDPELHRFTFPQLKTLYNTTAPDYKEFRVQKSDNSGLTAVDREEFDLMNALVESLGDFSFEASS
ncbi:unnamed protein product, partial [Mesorhabditis belari]|uniref:Uncharacterized protein n=1 Tax=Mesorhabditis belari TaxID=2138241 RepID=A0AAF3FQA6_9BILA